MYQIFKCLCKSANDSNNYKFEISYNGDYFWGGQYTLIGEKINLLSCNESIRLIKMPFPKDEPLNDGHHICFKIKGYAGHTMILPSEIFTTLYLYLIECLKIKGKTTKDNWLKYDIFFNNLLNDKHTKVDTPKEYIYTKLSTNNPEHLKLLIWSVICLLGEVDIPKDYLKAVENTDDVNEIMRISKDYVKFNRHDIKKIKTVFPEFCTQSF